MEALTRAASRDPKMTAVLLAWAAMAELLICMGA